MRYRKRFRRGRRPSRSYGRRRRRTMVRASRIGARF